jgi:hypothetical protein
MCTAPQAHGAINKIADHCDHVAPALFNNDTVAPNAINPVTNPA